MEKIHTLVIERANATRTIALRGDYDIFDVNELLFTITGTHWNVSMSKGVARANESPKRRKLDEKISTGQKTVFSCPSYEKDLPEQSA